jgi:hypothetical protein
LLLRRLNVVLLVVLAAAACARGTVTAQAPVDLAIPPLKNADGGLQESKDGVCNLQLFAGRIEKSSPGCYLDQKISEGPGMLRFPCKGDGTASADFGDHHYTGSIAAGEITLEHDSELDWEDGCRWGTHAIIRGAITRGGELLLRRVSWDYADRVVKGDACSGACTARAAIDVASPGASRPKPTAPVDLDDDDD